MSVLRNEERNGSDINGTVQTLRSQESAALGDANNVDVCDRSRAGTAAR
jgi:hypothetical protein